MLVLFIVVPVVLAVALPFLSPRLWRAVLRWVHVLWVCRVSVASVVLGFVIVLKVPQAQDLFADTSFGALAWGLFFAVAFSCWAIPVHYAARRLLERQEWAISGRLA